MSNTQTITFLKVDESAHLPEYQSPREAGADIRAWLPDGPVTLVPGARAVISSGFQMQLPDDFEVQIRPRSGLALKHGISIVNAPGTIDETYRGIVGVILINLGTEDYTIAHEDRIAQMVISPVVRFKARIAGSLDETDRGAGGFGSTGTR